jgi:hypothetical protein
MTAVPFDPLLSVFPCATDPDTVTDLPLSAIIARIRSPELAGATAHIAAAFARAGGGKAGKLAIDAAKKRLPSVTLAGSFDRRANKSWRDPSGLVQIDLDELAPAEKAAARVVLTACPWVACLWDSPSGAGLKGAVRVPVLAVPDPIRYTEAWRAVTRWLESVGLVNDHAAKDCSRLAYLAHDPNAWHNPQAEPFDCDPWAEPVPVPAPILPPSSVRGCIPAADVERRALAYVRAMPESVSGNAGSGTMVAVVRTLRDGFDLDGASFWRCLESWNMERAIPPWSRGELEHALASVENVPPQHPRGWLLEPATTRPLKGRQPDADVPDGSEAALAEYLAKTDLCHRLKWSTATNAGGWYEWTGTHWQATADRAPLALQAAVRRSLADGIEARAFDAKLASRLESAAAIRGVGSLLSAWPSMRLPAETDPPGLIACPRGVLDLATGHWLAHDPMRPITRCCPVDPGPTCPGWDMIERHLADCLGNLYPAVHRYLGSALTGLGADRRLLWLTGPGGDGKSTLVAALLAALGSYADPMAAETFAIDSRGGAHGHELASGLAVARLAVALEVSPRVNWSLLKTLSGGDRQKTKRAHGKAFAYDRPPCLVLVSNDPPTPPGKAEAERVILARLRPPDDADESLVAALKTPGPERDAIAAACLTWLIRGCTDFLAADRSLGPVPLIAFQPAGLDRWWSEGVATGRLVPGSTPRTPLEAIRQAVIAGGVDPLPSNNELAAFLKSVVPFKRTASGSRYAVEMTADDTGKHTPSHAYGGNVSAVIGCHSLPADVVAVGGMHEPIIIEGV